MVRFATSSTTSSTYRLAMQPNSDLERTNASIFRDALSGPVISSLVTDGDGSRKGGKLARERRLRKIGRARNGRREDKDSGSTENGKTGGVVLEEESVDSDDDGTGQSDMEDLGDFVDYLSSEIFTSLPEDLRNMTYVAMQDDEALASKYQLPLHSSTVEDIASTLPTSIADSLLAYDLFLPIYSPLSQPSHKTKARPRPRPRPKASKPSKPTPAIRSSLSGDHEDPHQILTTFLRPILTTYITTTTTPPLSPSHPSWRATRATTPACELCHRDWVPLTYHHLIPRSTHARVLKRGWHRPEMLNVVAWLCRPCHDTVHRVVPSNEELARSWYSVELLMGREDIRSFVGWVGRVRGLAR